MDDLGAMILGQQPQAKQAAPTGAAPSAVTDELLDSLRMIESSGGKNVGPHPKTGAAGPYQHIPDTQRMLAKKYGEYDPFNEAQSRERTRQYLTDLVAQNKGDVRGALKDYGGFVTKDPTKYINDVLGGMKEAKEAPDELGKMILGGETVATTQEQKPAKPSIEWKDVPTMAAANVIPSAVAQAKGLYEAVTHPVETVKSLYNVGKGAAEYLGEKAMQLGKPEFQMERDPEAAAAAKQMKDFYVERYGSEEGFKEALAKDPVGVAMDLATVAAPSSAARKVMGKPFTAAGGIVKTALGETTGVGGKAIERAYQAGKAGDKTFLEHLTGTADMTDALEAARSGLDKMRQDKNTAYRSGMVDITKDKSVLGFNKIDNALENAKKTVSYEGQIKNQPAAEVLGKMQGAIDEWKSLDPAVYRTPEGFDALKQKLGGMVDSIPREEKTAHMVATQIYNQVKKSISDQAPAYSKVMGEYADASEQIRQIEKSLSINDKASVDTAMRKLQSIMRDNVNTNYGYRAKLAKELEEKGGKEFMNAIAGQALSSPTPRGLAKLGLYGTTAAVMQNPALAGVFAAQSPRLVGSAAYRTGQAVGKISEAAKAGKMTPARGTALADILATTGKEKQK